MKRLVVTYEETQNREIAVMVPDDFDLSSVDNDWIGSWSDYSVEVDSSTASEISAKFVELPEAARR